MSATLQRCLPLQIFDHNLASSGHGGMNARTPSEASIIQKGKTDQYMKTFYIRLN